MKKIFARVGVLSAMFALAVAAPALAQNPTIDYYGFAWEDGAFPPSNPGDVLEFCGVATFADALFGVDLGADELTFRIYGLVSTGEVDLVGWAPGHLPSIGPSLIVDKPRKNGRVFALRPNLGLAAAIAAFAMIIGASAASFILGPPMAEFAEARSIVWLHAFI